ncbi:porin [Cupriavidus lacunae]|uniref:porin n=1 Tax=Cupriavidus lacunae TaxID=2666307 RepID=UPI001FC96853|nr:porin [Cupriavidus lacunae]
MPVAALTGTNAHAEPGVTVYGIVSSAVRYTSNLDGQHNDQAALVSGGMVGSRFGLKGDEDLGGGNHAVAPALTRCFCKPREGITSAAFPQ